MIESHNLGAMHTMSFVSITSDVSNKKLGGNIYIKINTLLHQNRTSNQQFPRWKI
jgi:hypothetical protein